MDDINISQSYSSNGCLQLNINVNPNNNNKNFSVPQNSIENGNIQINITINTNNFQESSSLEKITKLFIDQSQQTDDLEYKLKQENQKSDELSTGTTELDQFGTQIPENTEIKSFSPERKDEDNKHIDNNNETMDNLSTVSDQDTVTNNKNNDEQKHLKENQMEMNKTTGEDDMPKPNELETTEIDLKSSNNLQIKNTSEPVNNNAGNLNNLSQNNFINERSYSNNGKLLSDEKPETKSRESHCYESDVNMRESYNMNKDGNVKYQVKDSKYQNKKINNEISCLNDSNNCQNITENENQNKHVDNPICNKNERIPTQENLNRVCTMSNKHHTPGGLCNSATTSYMNAIIQALSSSNVLINSLKNISKSHSNSSVSLLYDLLNALNEENINDEIVMRNTNLLENLIESVGWNKPSQQDAFDLLSTLIRIIYKKSNDSDELDSPLKIKLLHEFQGIKTPNRIQEYLGLSLNLCGNYQNVPLEFLIDQYFISTEIDEDQSKLTRLSLYREIPNILLIHIQANKWDPIKNQMIKPTYYIQYDENMTLWLDIVNEMNGENRNLNEDRVPDTEVKYHLKSIVHHVGNISGGHYVAYRKWREEWYLADDESIKKEPLNKSISPYIMIYERSL